VAATAGLYWTTEGMLWTGVILLIIANVGFEGGTVFYDAFLPEISSEKDYGKISGYGFAVGYMGSFIILFLILPLIGGENPPLENTRLTFLIAAGFFALFSIPMFLFVPEHKRARTMDGNLLIAGYKRLRETLTHLRRYRDVERFLIAFFIYNDAILTVILFAGIFAEETLAMEVGELIYFFLIVQGTALIGSLIFGSLTNRIGARQALVITLIIWIGVVVVAYFVEAKMPFYIIGAIAGIGLGSSQSTSRALMALLTPFEKKTEFFGFYDGFFGKASAVLGPLIFGELAVLVGQREAMLFLGVMFLAGILLLMRVPDVRAGTSP
jgi:UMF1 family MFS transporter